MTGYSGELGEELDQQRICVGGVVTGVRRVITKARATMGVATLEDLQGTMEVIVFPKVFEQTEQTWAEDAILLVAGRVDHKGDETVLLADAVWTWEDALAMGADSFARELERTDRGRRNGPRNGHAGGRDRATHGSRSVAVGPGVVAPSGLPGAEVLGLDSAGPDIIERAQPERRLVRTVALVSPLRGGAAAGTIDVYSGSTRSVAARAGTPVVGRDALPLDDDERSQLEEAPLPEEAIQQLIAQQQAATLPTQAAAGQVLHVRFMAAGQEHLVDAFRALREIIHEHPGETPVVLHIPAGGGRNQRMELRVSVAYDAELVAMIGRLVGQGTVQLSLRE